MKENDKNGNKVLDSNNAPKTGWCNISLDINRMVFDFQMWQNHDCFPRKVFTNLLFPI